MAARRSLAAVFGWHSYRDRLHALWRRQDGRCIYCEQHAILFGEPVPPEVIEQFRASPRPRTAHRYRRATVEHLHRVADGGSDDPANLLMACNFCNSTRDDADPMVHRARMMELVRVGLHPHCPGVLEEHWNVHLVVIRDYLRVWRPGMRPAVPMEKQHG